MARTRQKTPRVGKPMPGRRKPTVQQKPVPAERTAEQLQAAIVELVDNVETMMRKHPRPPFRLNMPHAFPALDESRNAYNKLCWALDKALNPDGVEETEPDNLETWLAATFTDPAGAVPRWSRRGSFIVWVEYLPMLVRWESLLKPDLTAVAIDPSQPFIRDLRGSGQMTLRPSEIAKARKQPSAGYIGLGGWHSIPSNMSSVADLVCCVITAIGPHTLLSPLTEEAKQNVRSMLASEPWISEAMKGSHALHLPLPPHLHAIPQSLFG